MLLARRAAATLRSSALTGRLPKGQAGRLLSVPGPPGARLASGARLRSAALVRHLSSTATPDDDGGQAQGHPRDGRPSLFSKKTVDFAAVLEEYEHPTPARISQKNQRRRFSAARRPRITRAVDATHHGRARRRI